MSGTVKGGKRAALTNKQRHGDDFYQRIGRKGGSNGNTGGFASDRSLAITAGTVGGRLSIRRRKDESDEAYNRRKAARKRQVLAELRLSPSKYYDTTPVRPVKKSFLQKLGVK